MRCRCCRTDHGGCVSLLLFLSVAYDGMVIVDDDDVVVTVAVVGAAKRGCSHFFRVNWVTVSLVVINIFRVIIAYIAQIARRIV